MITTQEDYLLSQGEAIGRALENAGYQTSRRGESLSWEVTRPDSDFWILLLYLPRPVAQWRLLPPGHDDYRTEVYCLIEETLGGRR